MDVSVIKEGSALKQQAAQLFFAKRQRSFGEANAP